MSQLRATTDLPSALVFYGLPQGANAPSPLPPDPAPASFWCPRFNDVYDVHSVHCIWPRCEHCRSHFLEMYGTCENHRCDIPLASSLRGSQDPEGQDKLALWVWRMHNAVNARLHREGEEETELYK